MSTPGRSIWRAATFGLGSVLGGIIGGVLYGTFGPTAYFAAAGAMAIAGGLGAWVALYGPVGAPANPRPGPLLAPDVP